MEYSKYLKTDGWQRTRRWALDRAGNKCQLCKSTTKLNVHHSDYSRLGKEEPQDVIVLCERCHKIHHDNQPTKKTKKKEEPIFILWKTKNKKINSLIDKLEQNPSEEETLNILRQIDNFNKDRISKKFLK